MSSLSNEVFHWAHLNADSPQRALVRRMASVDWMSKREFWWEYGWIFPPPQALPAPHRLTLILSLTTGAQEMVWGRTVVALDLKWRPIRTLSPVLCLIFNWEWAPRASTANPPSRGNPVRNLSCGEMLNYSSSFCASVQRSQLFCLLLLWQSLSFSKH